MFYSQYLFAIGVLICLDLDDFYHPFAFASQQTLLSLFALCPALKRLSLSTAHRSRWFGVFQRAGSTT
jgi:hypothetical protein